MADMKDKLYTVAELSQKWRISPQTVQRWIREGKIKAFKVGRSWRIPEQAFDIVLQEQT